MRLTRKDALMAVVPLRRRWQSHVAMPCEILGRSEPMHWDSDTPRMSGRLKILIIQVGYEKGSEVSGLMSRCAVRGICSHVPS